jgi:hypothetical protein
VVEARARDDKSHGRRVGAFEEAWRSKGATEHGYAEDYRRIGKRLVDFLIESRSRGVAAPAPPISLGWAEGEMRISPDGVALGAGGRVTVRRVKTGKQRSNAFDDIEYTVLQLAAVQAYGPHAQVEVTYLTSETIPADGNHAAQAGVQARKAAILPSGDAGRAVPRQARGPQLSALPDFFSAGRRRLGARKTLTGLSGLGWGCD